MRAKPSCRLASIFGPWDKPNLTGLALVYADQGEVKPSKLWDVLAYWVESWASPAKLQVVLEWTWVGLGLQARVLVNPSQSMVGFQSQQAQRATVARYRVSIRHHSPRNWLQVSAVVVHTLVFYWDLLTKPLLIEITRNRIINSTI